MEEYEDLVKQAHPHFSVVDGYVNLNTPVVMKCSRCGGKFRRLAQVNRTSECPVCFTVYIAIYKTPPGFLEAVAGLDDIRDLGKGNMDRHFSAKDTTMDDLGDRYARMGMWGMLLHDPGREDDGIDRIVADAVAKFNDRL